MNDQEERARHALGRMMECIESMEKAHEALASMRRIGLLTVIMLCAFNVFAISYGEPTLPQKCSACVILGMCVIITAQCIFGEVRALKERRWIANERRKVERAIEAAGELHPSP